MTQTNLTTETDLLTFLGDEVFQNMSSFQLKKLVALYPNSAAAGSPFGTGTNNEPYPNFKRLSAILGDTTFTLMRRSFLELAPKSMKTWSYLSTYGRGTPILGTFHTMDLNKMFYGMDDLSRSMQNRYIAFVDSLDPNNGKDSLPKGFDTSWPLWRNGRKLIEFAANRTDLLIDDFRNDCYYFVKMHLRHLRV